jgi:hypothetical protein
MAIQFKKAAHSVTDCSHSAQIILDDARPSGMPPVGIVIALENMEATTCKIRLTLQRRQSPGSTLLRYASGFGSLSSICRPSATSVDLDN